MDERYIDPLILGNTGSSNDLLTEGGWVQGRSGEEFVGPQFPLPNNSNSIILDGMGEIR